MRAPRSYSVYVQQYQENGVESELSCLKDLIKSQDDQSREQAGALDQLNQLGPQLLSHVLGLKKAFNPTIDGNEDQVRSWIIVSINQLVALKCVSLINHHHHHHHHQNYQLQSPSLYPSETNGRIIFGNHALDLSQLQPAPESESVLDWGRLFTLRSPFDWEDPIPNFHSQSLPQTLERQGNEYRCVSAAIDINHYQNRTEVKILMMTMNQTENIHMMIWMRSNCEEMELGEKELDEEEDRGETDPGDERDFSRQVRQAASTKGWMLEDNQSLGAQSNRGDKYLDATEILATCMSELAITPQNSFKRLEELFKRYNNMLDNLNSWVDDWEGDLKEWFNWSERNLVKIDTTATNNVKGEMMLKEDYIRFDSAKAKTRPISQTKSFHFLVLDYASGGELFKLRARWKAGKELHSKATECHESAIQAQGK
ncbi:hypothetical protein PPACK8108_LOCUS22579 [Phakopsora pachyrhizi]|uniref:Uncharacterized protein n=1 Tax=Phakopsora pachyrhizi TaxID=170000 RepID=A0AAV0BNJ2_PHAPC|nr:hypothetical protein PPACK8108_LOCUS22579 [Phakopsora pachyrhizi]